MKYEIPDRCEKQPGMPADRAEDHGRGHISVWRMKTCFKCPICGLCLSMSEQQHLLRKAGYAVKNMSSYDMHEIFVNALDKETRLSRMIDALLRRKYAGRARHLLEAGESDFLSLWRISFEQDDQAALWAAAVRPGIPDADIRKIFGWVHMAMHTSACQHGKLMHDLTRQADELATMRGKYEEELRARRSLHKENVAQSVLLEGLKSKLAVLREDRRRLEQQIENQPHPPEQMKGDQDDKNLFEERETLLQRLQTLEGELSGLREENRRLKQALDEQSEANSRSAREVRELLANMRVSGACDKSCPAYDLCKKRILIVGGITKMEALYRQLIEGSGGIFEYHDGYVKGGVRKLEVCMKRADMVLCPLDCNSHAACSLVKNLGKKYRKPVHILANSSLNAVMQALGGRSKPQIQGY